MKPNITVQRPHWKIQNLSLDKPRTRPRRSLIELLSPWLIVGGFVLFLMLLCALIGE